MADTDSTTDSPVKVTPMELIGQAHDIMKYVKSLTKKIERLDDVREIKETFQKYQQISKGIIPARSSLHVTLTPFHDNLLEHLRGIHALLLMDTEKRLPFMNIKLMSGGGLRGAPSELFGDGEPIIPADSKDPLDYHLVSADDDGRFSNEPTVPRLVEDSGVQMSGGAKTKGSGKTELYSREDPELSRAIKQFNDALSGGFI